MISPCAQTSLFQHLGSFRKKTMSIHSEKNNKMFFEILIISNQLE